MKIVVKLFLIIKYLLSSDIYISAELRFNFKFFPILELLIKYKSQLSRID